MNAPTSNWPMSLPNSSEDRHTIHVLREPLRLEVMLVGDPTVYQLPIRVIRMGKSQRAEAAIPHTLRNTGIDVAPQRARIVDAHGQVVDALAVLDALTTACGNGIDTFPLHHVDTRGVALVRAPWFEMVESKAEMREREDKGPPTDARKEILAAAAAIARKVHDVIDKLEQPIYEIDHTHLASTLKSVADAANAASRIL